MKKSIFLALSIAFLSIQCNTKKEEAPTETTTEPKTEVTTETSNESAFTSQYGIIIASKQVDCQGVANQKCFLTKSVGGTKWELLYSSIEGFNFEEGNEYHLEIKKTEIKNHPADTPNAKYKLVKVISKEKKDSDIRMESEKPTFDSTWDIVMLNEKALKKGFIAFRNDGSANANAGCNNMAGIKFKTDASKKTIKFDTSKVASTMMACPNDYDNEFQEALTKVTHFEEVSKNKLLLKENTTTLLELNR